MVIIKKEPNIDLGKKILSFLDTTYVKPTVFFWFYLKESNSWRLMLSSRAYKNINLHEAYTKFISEFGNNLDVLIVGLPNITILNENDKLIGLFRLAFKTEPGSLSSIRLQSCMVHGVYVEDVFIYRLR